MTIFSTDLDRGKVEDGFRTNQVRYIYCALCFYYDISSTSDHQALDPGSWGPLLLEFNLVAQMSCGIPRNNHHLKWWLSPVEIIIVQSLSHVRLFVTPWAAARKASLSITNSRSLLKLMSIESLMPSNHLVLCCPLYFMLFLPCDTSYPFTPDSPVLVMSQRIRTWMRAIDKMRIPSSLGRRLLTKGKKAK